MSASVSTIWCASLCDCEWVNVWICIHYTKCRYAMFTVNANHAVAPTTTRMEESRDRAGTKRQWRQDENAKEKVLVVQGDRGAWNLSRGGRRCGAYGNEIFISQVINRRLVCSVPDIVRRAYSNNNDGSNDGDDSLEYGLIFIRLQQRSGRCRRYSQKHIWTIYDMGFTGGKLTQQSFAILVRWTFFSSNKVLLVSLWWKNHYCVHVLH